MKLFRRKSFEEKVKIALTSYHEDAVASLFPAGVSDAVTAASGLAGLCGMQPERCSVAQCEELLDLYAEVANAATDGINREKKITLLRKKYGGIVNGFSVAEQICNFCEERQGTGSEFPAEEDVADGVFCFEDDGPDEPDSADADEDVKDPEEELFSAGSVANLPELLPEPAENGLRALAENLTGIFDLGGKERRKALETLKPERKRYLRNALEKFADNAEGAVRSVFEAGCIASGGKLLQTDTERDLPGLILTGSGADTDWAEMDEQQKKDILKLAWQMGVRAGIRRKDKPEKVPEMETGMAEEQTE